MMMPLWCVLRGFCHCGFAEARFHPLPLWVFLFRWPPISLSVPQVVEGGSENLVLRVTFVPVPVRENDVIFRDRPATCPCVLGQTPGCHRDPVFRGPGHTAVDVAVPLVEPTLLRPGQFRDLAHALPLAIPTTPYFGAAKQDPPCSTCVSPAFVWNRRFLLVQYHLFLRHQGGPSSLPAPSRLPCTSSGIYGCHDTPRMTRHTAVVVVGLDCRLRIRVLLDSPRA